MTQHEKLLKFLFENSANININKEPEAKGSVTWNLVKAQLPIELYPYFWSKFKTNSWKLTNTKDIAKNSAYATITTTVVYMPSGNKYWNQVISLYEDFIGKDYRDTIKDIDITENAVSTPYAYFDANTKLPEENEMPIDDVNEFTVKNILFVDIGGYEYEIDRNNPDPKDIAHVFEAAVDMLEKIQNDVARLEDVANKANVLVPVIAMAKYNEQERELQSLINDINSLNA